jgi:hypothetical protein
MVMNRISFGGTDMSDRPVPQESDEEGAKLPADESHQDPEALDNELAERSKTHEGETKNRDESEFTYNGLKTPNIITDLPEVQDESK